MKLHHFGIATSDISYTINYMKHFFALNTETPIIYDKNQDAFLCMLEMEDGTKVELISGKIVEKLVKKRQYLYHICYEVGNIEDKIEEFIEQGGILISAPKEAVLFQNRKVAFVSTEIGMIELLEKEKIYNQKK